MDSVVDTALSWMREGEDVAVATVVRTWRSSPCPAGSRLVADGRGRFAGSVSGGCVESAVVGAARELLQGARPATLSFGVTQERAWEVGLPCGGTIEVFVARADRAAFAARSEAAGSRRVLESVTDLDDGRVRSFAPESRPADLAPPVAARLGASGGDDLAEVVGASFVERVGPAPRMVVVGAVRLSQALAEMARLAGFAVTVVDPRGAFATPERFPGVHLVSEWPDRALEDLALDARTSVVVVSHDAKLDVPALSAALRSDAFYVGALGSRRTQAARRARLSEDGHDDASLDRIAGPVGLAIGAVTPEEIAVAILAQAIERYRGSTSPATA